MIALTRLNDRPFLLNASWIEQVESLPDTTITLTSGKKLVVKESVEEVCEKTVAFFQQVGLLKGIQTEKEEHEHV